MRKTLLLWATLSLAGCSVQRSATTTQQTENRRDTTATAQVASVTSQRTEQTLDTDCVTTTTTDEFDTSQPVDPLTGTPPVKRRTTSKQQKKTTAAATVEQAASTTQTQAIAATSSSQSQTATADELERKVGTHALIWCILGALAVAAGLVFWKRFKNT